MGTIYPFAGSWRTVALHKGAGPTKWPFPPRGIQPLMDVLQRDVLSRSPCITNNDEEIFDYASEVMNEMLAIHPFREGNGRTAFLIGNLILMQNDMLPLSTYERRMDEHRYYAACEAGRISKGYEPLAALLAEWSARSRARWEKRQMDKERRVDLRGILAQPDLRRELMVATIQATQTREGIDTTKEQAQRAYYVVTEGERVAFFDLERFRGGSVKQDRRCEMFVRALTGDATRIRYDIARRELRCH